MANGLQGRDILFGRRISQSKLDGLQSACEQRIRLFRQTVGLHQPETATVISLQRPRLATQQSGERHSPGPRECIPERHVEQRKRHPHRAGDAEQCELTRKRPRRVVGSHRAARQQIEGLRQMCGDRACSRWSVAECIGMPGHAVVGHEIDQQERNRPDDRRTRSEREVERNEHTARDEGTKLERSHDGIGESHRIHPSGCRAEPGT